jgi:uncharacterized membrane protein
MAACHYRGYSRNVAGAHRGKPDNSAFIALAAVITVPLVLLGSLVYFCLRHPTGLYLLVSLVDCVVVVQSVHRLVLNLAKQQAQIAEELVTRLSLYAQLVAAVGLVLTSIGYVLHWTSNEMFRDSTIGLSFVYVIGMPLYWLGGKRLLIASLKARGFGSEPEA